MHTSERPQIDRSDRPGTSAGTRCDHKLIHRPPRSLCDDNRWWHHYRAAGLGGRRRWRAAGATAAARRALLRTPDLRSISGSLHAESARLSRAAITSMTKVSDQSSRTMRCPQKIHRSDGWLSGKVTSAAACSVVRLSSRHMATALTRTWHGCGQSSCRAPAREDEVCGDGSDEWPSRSQKMYSLNFRVSSTYMRE